MQEIWDDIEQRKKNLFTPIEEIVKANNLNTEATRVIVENFKKYFDDLLKDNIFAKNAKHIKEIRYTVILSVLDELSNSLRPFLAAPSESDSKNYLLQMIAYIYNKIDKERIFSYIKSDYMMLKALNFTMQVKSCFRNLIQTAISPMLKSDFFISDLICEIIVTILKQIQTAEFLTYRAGIELLEEILYPHNKKESFLIEGLDRKILIEHEKKKLQNTDIQDSKTYVTVILSKLLKNLLFQIRQAILEQYKMQMIIFFEAVCRILRDGVTGEWDTVDIIQIKCTKTDTNNISQENIEYHPYSKDTLSHNEFLFMEELRNILGTYQHNSRISHNRPKELYDPLNKTLHDLVKNENLINEMFAEKDHYLHLLVKLMVFFENEHQNAYNLDKSLFIQVDKNYKQIEEVQKWIKISYQLSQNVHNSSQDSKVLGVSRRNCFSFEKDQKSELLSRIAVFLEANIGILSARAIKMHKEKDILNHIYTIIKFAAHKKRNPFGFLNSHASKELEALVIQEKIDKNALTEIDLDKKAKIDLYNAKTQEDFDEKMKKIFNFLPMQRFYYVLIWLV